MELWYKLKCEIWSPVKVRLRYGWWIARYGGKKNIPKELIFEQMQKSMERLEENLQDALRAMPDDVDETERKQLREAILEASELKGRAEEVFEKSEKESN